jgi:hypothetical protein
MTRHDDPRHSDAAGKPFDRRTALERALRAGAALALGTSLPAALAACGTKTAVAKDTRYNIRYLESDLPYKQGGLHTGSPPLGDLARLIRARALEAGVHPSMAPWSPDMAFDIRDEAAPTGAGPRSYELKRIAPLVVLGLADRSVADAAAADVLKAGVQVVSYLLALDHQTAAIAVDPARAGALLATHVAAWARKQIGGRGRVLLIRPQARTGFASTVPESERALRATLTRLVPGVEVTATAKVGVAEAVSTHPGTRIVLCWDQRTDLVDAARALRALHRGGRERLYVGGLGLPALESRETIDELRRDDVLRAVVAVRPRDLARALVDLPRALLFHEPARDVDVGFQLLTPGSSALAAHAADYARDPNAFVRRVGKGVGSLGLGPPLRNGLQ